MDQNTMRATVDVATAAQILGVNKLTLYDAIKRGDSPVPIVRVGRRILVPQRALDMLLEGEVVQ